MTSRTPRIVLAVVGGIITLVGLVWTLQGLGIIRGSFMTGSTKWFVIGLVMDVVGILLLVFALRRAPRRP